MCKWKQPEAVPNITPGHYPEAVARNALEQAKGAKAIFVIILDHEDCLWVENAGHQAKDVLWALESAKLKLLLDSGDN